MKRCQALDTVEPKINPRSMLDRSNDQELFNGLPPPPALPNAERPPNAAANVERLPDLEDDFGQLDIADDLPDLKNDFEQLPDLEVDPNIALVATQAGRSRRGPDDIGQLLCVFALPRSPITAIELFRSTATDPEFLESAEQHTRIADQMAELVLYAVNNKLLCVANAELD